MIDRKKVVERNFPKYRSIEALAPLSVGNGDFAFTADATGLQTFSADYQVPLGTQSQWGWHFHKKPNYYTLEDSAFQSFDTYGREVEYPLYPQDKEEAYHWLRQNPHRLHLGQIGFRLLKENNEKAELKDIKQIDQVLNLWEGVLYSHFMVEDVPVSVLTVCHPETDEIAVKVISPLLSLGRLNVFLSFPSPEMTSPKWEESIFPDYETAEGHKTILCDLSEHSASFQRVMHEDHYEVNWTWSSGQLQQSSEHYFQLFPDQVQEELSFTVSFAAQSPKHHSFQEVFTSSLKHWEHFWNKGGVIDFSESSDPRANELERRVVLSQFLTAIHCSGSTPPQETGLMYNSWFGKFHLEMHWWHGAHFPLWGREDVLAKSLDWYQSILPLAKDLAKKQGYEGARWPKQVGVDGKQSPSPIAPLLIWQQPHPISLAELCYQADPSTEILKRWEEIIVQTAKFMVSFAVWSEEKKAYVLGPPLIPSQECHDPAISINPPYELEYWKYGLENAVKWMERLGKTADPKWAEVAASMAKPPHANGVYLAHENCPDTFTEFNHDHPSMVAALGILPGSLIDPQIMKNTLKRVQNDWQWETAWGWDFPMCAMTAARLGDGDTAVDFLLMDTVKNTYLPNGHNYQTPSLSCYLPGNGGLLAAVAMMACGWRGNENHDIPGFPQDGTWNVKWEGLRPLL